MKVLIAGSGLIGPTAAFYTLAFPEVTEVLLADVDQSSLELAGEKLSSSVQVNKLELIQGDVTDPNEKLWVGIDLVISAVPRAISHQVIRTATAKEIPVIELTLPLDAEMTALESELEGVGVPVIIGVGLEPGLTEIMARYAARDFEQIDELHIQVGGVPEKPTPPLGYKLLFGGQGLPLSEASASMVCQGRLVEVERYTGVERISFPEIGDLEAHYEMFMPWILDLPEFGNLKLGTQKTIRWPGFAEKARALRDLGLLSQKPVEVDGLAVTPKEFLDRIIHPLVKLEAGEYDLTLFRVVVLGTREGKSCRCKIEMVDHFDKKNGFTSMSRTVGATGACIARLVLCGKVKDTGILRPEQVVTGEVLEELRQGLEGIGIRFSETCK